MKEFKIKANGFTLIELLVVIAIIALLVTFSVYQLNMARSKGKDARRLVDVTQIQKGLELYYDEHGNFPEEDSSNGGWEISDEDGGDFIDELKDRGYMKQVPVDPSNYGGKFYEYMVFAAGDNGCDATKGDYYVLGITDMEGSGRPNVASPGFSCGSKDWKTDFDWVTGRFEK